MHKNRMYGGTLSNVHHQRSDALLAFAIWGVRLSMSSAFRYAGRVPASLN